MAAFALLYKDDLKRQKKVDSQFLFPDFQILHTEVEELMERDENDHRGMFKSLLEHHFSIYQHNEIIAWVVLLPLDKITAKLITRFIGHQADVRLTAKIYCYIEDFAGRKGLKNITVYATPTAMAFYRSLGFQYENAMIHESGTVFYVMKKEI